MADSETIHIGENSPEKIAYILFTHIMSVEDRALYASGNNPVNRKEILGTYAECLKAVQFPGQRLKG